MGLGKFFSNVAGGLGDIVNNPLKAVNDGLNDKATLTGLAALAAAPLAMPYLTGAGAMPVALGEAGGYGLGAVAGGGAAAGLPLALGEAGGYGAAAASAAGDGAGSLWTSPAFLNTLGSLGSAYLQNSAAKDAAGAQGAAAQAGIAEQGRQFDAVRQLLAPYVGAGNMALGQQGALAGLGGAQQQQAAIDAIKSGPQFTSMLQQGENSILANASATGGLRGGNTQAALAQFSPQLLNQLIDQQYSRLGGLTSLGQNSAVMQGNAGMQTGNQISNLLQQQGAAQAGGALAGGRFGAQAINGIAAGFGQRLAQGGF